VLALFPAAAMGQGNPVPNDDTAAVVQVGNCTAPGAAALPRAFRNALKSLGAPVLSEAETAAPLGGLSLRSMAELKRALADARDDFINGQVARALQTLQTLPEDIERLPPSVDRWDLERSALASLAQVQGRSDKTAAQATLRRILAVEPDYAPDSSVFPPSFLAEVTNARNAMGQTPTGKLAVATEPAGTGVAVGGRPMGQSPLSLRLPPETYRLEAMWGYRGLSRSVQVGAPPQPPVSVDLKRSIEGSILPDAGPCVLPVPSRDAALARFAALLKVKRLYAVRTEVSGAEQTVVAEEFDAATGTVVRENREPVVPQGPVSDAATRLAENVTGPKRSPEGTTPSTINTGLRTWAYIFGGVGIAATAVGVILFISGNSQINSLNNQYTQNGGTFPTGDEPSFQSQNNSGKTDKTIGVIVGGVGVAALVTGVTLFFVSSNGGGSSTVAINPYIQPGAGGVVIAGRF
jgi:hypothetical protein